MNPFLSGKAALVTGATKGIGREIAKSLALAGAQVTICGRTSQTTSDAVNELKAETQASVFGQSADVSNREQVEALFALAEREMGGVDIVVNNAGIGLFASVADMKPGDWDRVIGTNLTGVFHASQQALFQFRKRGGGYLFQIGSLAGKHAFAGSAAYSASKFALNGFSEALMLDHRYENVRVTTILPGSVDTAFSPRGTGERASWKIQPEDIAQIVLSLLALPDRTMVSSVEVRPSRPKKS
jgi:NAD(P)-dependent dehydrogenase (short-subunit alcohol dehydrogenase family)